MTGMTIRPSAAPDLDAVLDLLDAKRVRYAGWQPVFHRPAAGAKEMQRPFVGSLFTKPDFICLTAEVDGKVAGFLQGRIVSAPPVYDPGGPVLMIDDFVVADEAQWPTAGRALVDDARRIAKERGVVLVNVVCGPRDEPKRRMLRDAGLTVASEWFVAPI